MKPKNHDDYLVMWRELIFDECLKKKLSGMDLRNESGRDINNSIALIGYTCGDDIDGTNNARENA